MSRLIKSTWFVLLIAGLLVACAAPAPTLAPVPATQPESTQPAPAATSVPSIPSEQVTISVVADNETFDATVIGNGETAVIVANTVGNDTSRWLPLVDALSSNENLRIVTFAYRDEATDTSNADTRAVFEYLRTEGIKKIICVGSGYGSSACGYLQSEPEILGMVFISVDHIAKVDGIFPKLFLTADTDPVISAGQTQLVYEQSAEPKTFKTYAAGVHGPALFFKVDVGPQVLADITDFINEIVNSQ